MMVRPVPGTVLAGPGVGDWASATPVPTSMAAMDLTKRTLICVPRWMIEHLGPLFLAAVGVRGNAYGSANDDRGGREDGSECSYRHESSSSSLFAAVAGGEEVTGVP